MNGPSWKDVGAALLAALVAGGCNSPLPPPCGACPAQLLPCASSVESYCASAAQPICSWTVFSDPTSTRFDCRHTGLNTSCGPYDNAWQFGVDTGVQSYYDRATGQLVAVVADSANTQSSTCLAGPASGFSPPACPATDFTTVCPDAGP